MVNAMEQEMKSQECPVIRKISVVAVRRVAYIDKTAELTYESMWNRQRCSPYSTKVHIHVPVIQ